MFIPEHQEISSLYIYIYILYTGHRANKMLCILFYKYCGLHTFPCYFQFFLTQNCDYPIIYMQCIISFIYLVFADTCPIFKLY